MLFSELPNTKNIRLHFDHHSLYLSCDLSKDFGASSSGKTIVIASSCGNKALGKSNAYLGLNLFVKSLEKRELTSKGVQKLQKDTYEPVGTSGLSWRIEDDGVTLCIKLDFDAATEKPAGSGKSILLFSTLGNKPIGDTGIMCGLNCYRPESQSLNISELSGENANSIKKGEEKQLDEFTQVKYVTKENGVEEITISVQVAECLHREDSSPSFSTQPSPASPPEEATEGKRKREKGENEEKSGSGVSHSFNAGDVQIQLHIRSPTSRKRKLENDLEISSEGGLPKNTDVRNITTCMSKDNALSIAFNPTLSFGTSSSGKSIAVASSLGFQPLFSSQGVEIGRISFNAFKPCTSNISVSDVDKALKETLDKVPEESRSSLSFKSVRDDVLKNLDLSEKAGERYHKLIKERVKVFMAIKEK